MRYPLFGSGNKGQSVNVTAQTRVNLYVEYRKDQDKTNFVIYGTPGKRLFTSFGETPIRGVRVVGDLQYIVHRSTLYSVNNAGEKVALGMLNTSAGRVWLTDNGYIIQIVDGQYGYTYDIVTNTFALVSDPAFVPGFTNTWLSGYFLKDRRGANSPAEWGRFDYSEDGSTYDALDFANAESNPDYLEAVYTDHGEAVLFGTFTTEFWTNSGDLDLPLSYQPGATIEWGLAARASVCKFRDSVIFLAKNRLGEIHVVVLNGYSPTIVSTPDISYLFNEYGAAGDATAFSYIMNGHPFYQINFPSANKSWLFDGLSNEWSPLESNGGRDRAEIGYTFQDNYFVTDYANGNIYYLDDKAYTENGTSIKRQLVGKHVFDEEYVGMGRIILDVEPGVGIQDGQGKDPQIILEVSKDGGHTWGQELWRSLGQAGKYQTRVYWNRIGVFRDSVYRFTITDPVKVVILGAWIDLS